MCCHAVDRHSVDVGEGHSAFVCCGHLREPRRLALGIPWKFADRKYRRGRDRLSTTDELGASCSDEMEDMGAEIGLVRGGHDVEASSPWWRFAHGGIADSV